MNFSLPRRGCARLFVERSSWCRPVRRQVVGGWILTSMTPGSGVTLMTFSRWSRRRRIAFDRSGMPQLGGGIFDGGDQFDEVVDAIRPAAGRCTAGRRAARCTSVVRILSGTDAGRRLAHPPGGAGLLGDRAPWPASGLPSRTLVAGSDGRRGLMQVPRIGEASARRKGVERRRDHGVTSGASQRQGIQRQAESQRQIAGHQRTVAAAQRPRAGKPARPRPWHSRAGSARRSRPAGSGRGRRHAARRSRSWGSSSFDSSGIDIDRQALFLRA